MALSSIHPPTHPPTLSTASPSLGSRVLGVRVRAGLMVYRRRALLPVEERRDPPPGVCLSGVAKALSRLLLMLPLSPPSPPPPPPVVGWGGVT